MNFAAVPVSVTVASLVTLVTFTLLPLTAAEALPELTEAPRLVSQPAS